MNTSSSLKEKSNATEVVSSNVQSPNELIDFSKEEERAVVRKIDLWVLPVMCLIFFTQYLDKQIVAYTVVVGLREDLGLSGSQYSWLASAFSIAQLVSQIWNSYALSKFPIKIVTGVSVFLWGATCICTAAPKNFEGFIALRTILGFFEGAVSPAFVIITSVYYKKSEHALRTACWISCNALAQVLGNFLVYGVSKNDNLDIAIWRVVFLICGGLTIFMGVIFMLVIPLSPGEARFLSERERHIAVNRILAENDRGERTSFNFKQMLSSLKLDYYTICSFLFGFLVTVTSGPIIFSSLIISEMGYTGTKVLEFGAPSGAVQLGIIWLGVVLTTFFPKERCISVMCLALVPLVGTILLLALPETNPWGRIVASWLGSCITSIMSILLSLNASNTRGNTRKSLINNIFFFGYSLAAIIYPQWWNYTRDPNFRAGLIANICFWAFFEALVLSYRFVCISENKKRDIIAEKGEIPDYDLTLDLTDREDMYHRYSY
ncbi:uncharacterized protein PRCAT00004813001 [Priceomyces carsonii]|uniref:uncharacterized protein n=1 Tax=Priceomyces carsonii TaxID=28549 RepID=UPI002ED8CB05|nr:unnamed protein product [Priceomyces carsonii]